MSINDGRFERGNLIGNVTVPLVILPAIRGTVRRHDPDGSHAQPYFPSLSGTSLTVAIGVVGGGVTPFTINFATNNYNDAVAAVNAVSPGDFKWFESDGFACIQSQHAGGKNYLKITAGTAAPVLGIAIYPTPGGYSQAGDLATSPSDKVQQNAQPTELLSHDENLTTAGINRAILGALLGVESKLNDLDKEFVYYKTIVGSQFSSAGFADSDTFHVGGTDRISIRAIMNALQERQVVGLMTFDAYPVPLYQSNGTPIQVIAASYGASDTVSPTTQGVTWGSPPANPGAIFGPSLAASFKVPLINITSIVGGTIVATGAQFVTKKVVSGDVILVQGATNTSPFSHDGEFVISQVIDNNTIVVRSMGSNEPAIIGSHDRPRSLNVSLPPATSYGQVGVYIGWGIPQGPSGTSADTVFFKTNGVIPAGLNVKVRVPVTSSLREMAAEALLSNTAFDQDPEIAFQNKANIFALLNTFLQGIKLKSTTIDGISLLQKGRIQTNMNDGGSDNDFALMWDASGFTGTATHIRLYMQVQNSRFIIAQNAFYNPNTARWEQDDATTQSTRLKFGKFDYTCEVMAAGAVSSGDTWPTTAFSFPLRDKTADNYTPRVTFPIPSTASEPNGRFLLLEQTGPNQSCTRIYTESNGAGTGGIIITTNAVWASPDWTKDASGLPSVRFVLDSIGFRMQARKATSNAAWDDSTGWDQVTSVEIDIFSKFFNLTGGNLQLEPETSTTVPNPALTTTSGDYSPNRLAVWQDTLVTGVVNTVYASNGKIEFALGCHWKQDTAKWVSETPTTAGGQGGGSLFVIYASSSNSGRFLRKKASGVSANTWDDTLPPTAGGWDTAPLAVTPGAATMDGSLTLGTDLDNSLASAEIARVSGVLPAAITGDTTLVLTKIMEWGPAAEKFRLYVGGVNKEWRITYNAAWLGNASGWAPDVASASSNPAFAYMLGKQFKMLTKAATNAGNWAETAWSATPFMTDVATGQTSLQVSDVQLVSPLIKLMDGKGNIRSLYDHNGYPVGRRSEFREEWQTGGTTVLTQGASPPYNVGAGHQGTPALVTNAPTKFQMNGTANSGGWSIAADSKILSNAITFAPGSGAADKMYLQSVMSLCVKQNFLDLVLEWEAYCPTGAATCSMFMGLFSNYTTMSSSTNFVWFKSVNGATWTAETGDGSATSSGTAFAPSTSNFQRFRIEVHGSASAIGVANGNVDVVNFFINETFVATNLTHVYADGQQLSIGFGIENSANGGADMTVGPVYATWNRYASLPAL